MRPLIAAAAILLSCLTPALAAEPYAPMAPFAEIAGRTFRSEALSEDGLTDIARWEYILGGRALQSTHRLDNGAYGGRTIFFYDESAQGYLFHYFTTAGFHTEGRIELTETGFVSIEDVIGHPTIAQVHSTLSMIDGVMQTQTVRIHKDGTAGVPETVLYTVIEDVTLFPEENPDE